MAVQSEQAPGRGSGGTFFSNKRNRSLFFQALTILILIGFTWYVADNTAENLQRLGIASGFGFLGETSGFGFELLYDHIPQDTYFQAFIFGLINTAFLSFIGILLSTVIGFLMGVARLSPNWLIAKMATVYVETLRNVPLLLQILFWYFAVLAALPSVRNVEGAGGFFLTNRGFYMPDLVAGDTFWLVYLAFAAGIVISWVWYKRAKARQIADGTQTPVFLPTLGFVVGLPVIVYLVISMIFGWQLEVVDPTKSRFGLKGGIRVYPEFMALLFALSIYTGAFIAEIVRAGVLAVSHGQTEAANALGIRRGPTLRLVVIPQALRVIIPPLTSQYLNLTKNSSLAVAIGYPELVAVFGGTVLNQTGQAIEVISMTMATYLFFSICISLYMNWYNQRIALVER